MRAICILSVLLLSASCAPDRGGQTTTGQAVYELFDGKTLTGWRNIEFELGGGGLASVGADGSLQISAGEPMAALVLENTNIPLPERGYEIELEAKIVDGSDFFCGLTFPVPSQGTHCTLIVGGWGGTVVGISNVNGMDASINTTRHDRPFEPGRWYAIRARVSDDYLEVWIDGEIVIELEISRRKIAMRPGAIEQCKPIGLATWRTAAAYRNLRLRLR
ncbi:MAG: 3-keto-disaccharide hydrolase [Verrucomicrobiales bacterium]